MDTFVTEMRDKINFIIPPKNLMVQTSPGDCMPFYYFFLTNKIYRDRLSNTLKLLQPYKFNHLLEIGYGSGVFLPTLSQLSKKITGLDIHNHISDVKKLLKFYNVKNVKLVSADIMKMPFEDSTFDGVVIVSTLEDIKNSQKAVKEIKRVTKKNGKIFISFPVKNLITDIFFRLAGEDPEEIHPSDHTYILNYLKKNFKVVKILKYPRFFPLSLCAYLSVSCINT